jgi:hypothetical protein
MRALFASLAAIPVLVVSQAGSASACEFRADRAGAIDTQGVQKIVVRTGAGDLKVRGREGARIEAKGQACASSQALLDAVSVSVRREGTTAFVESVIPVEMLENEERRGYAYIDLDITLPANLPVDAQDSSGDAELSGLAALTMRDSSGDLEIERVKGAVDVQDSSGEARIVDVASVRLQDSSGDVRIEQVAGAVEVVSDSSGDLLVRNIGGRLDIRQDSSGDIRAEDVRGNVFVGIDSSGSIYARNVSGDFTVETDASGEIVHENVKGRISTPDH